MFEVLTTNLQFPAGVLSLPDGYVLVSERARGTLTCISPEGFVSALADVGGGPCGLAEGPNGLIYVCNNGGDTWNRVDGAMIPGDQPKNYTGGSIQTVNLATGEISVLYDEVDGCRLRGPSSLVFDRYGGFWFTDKGKTRKRQRDRGGLYYAKADGSHIEEVVYPLDAPSGVALSSDGCTLYVAESNQARVYSWPLCSPGKIAGYFGSNHRGTLVVDPEGGAIFSDLAVDPYGTICATSSGKSGIVTVTPEGSCSFSELDHASILGGISFDRSSDSCLAYVAFSGVGSLVSLSWGVSERPVLPVSL